ncbi:hypothetical protein BGZ96_011837 [Linnemannia gamsii]|uniref:Uncharacterized protein n=1 Tax=Linnemannia gamsii TaxID=64522 RepID=A0ABQ7JSH4_9FUNG|nr:hypothetical protein BGZ96_011837 [Linnemannia gamsii]
MGYLFPKRWDNLFTSTVRSLNCTNRSDIVAKPAPRYFVQLKSFLKRLVKAHVELKLLNWLAHGRSGSVFYYPSAALALMASYSYLKSKQIVIFWKLALVLTFVLGAAGTGAGGLAGPMWFVQTIYMQEWFLYELLQPYLARVQFKSWEEKAWLDRYQTELFGFVLGAWLICKIPWIGVAAMPVLFPATAFLLTRSCGSMENTSQGRSSGSSGRPETGVGPGDLIERRAPGIKLVAQGNHPSVRGDWEAIKVLTMVQSDPDYALQAGRDFKPKVHDLNWKNSSVHYSVDKGFDSALTRAQVEEDRIRSQSAMEALYREAEREAHRQQFHSHHHRPDFRSRGFGRGPSPWDVRMDPRFAIHATHTAGPSSSTSSALVSGPMPSPITSTVQDPTTESIPPSKYHSLEEEDLMRYNFSDRKTLDSAPSAPREEDLLPLGGVGATGAGTVRAGGQVSTHFNSTSNNTKNNSNSNLQSTRDYEIWLRDQERMFRDQGRLIRDQENQIRSRENRIRAKENQRRADERQIRRQARSQTERSHVGGGGGGYEERDEAKEDGDEAYEDEEEEEYQEAREDNEEEFEFQGEVGMDDACQTRRVEFSREGGRGSERGMFAFAPRGRGGGRGTGTGVEPFRGFMRGIATRGQERGIGRWGRGSRRTHSQSQQGQVQEPWLGHGHGRLRSRSISDNVRHTNSSPSTSTTGPSSPTPTPPPPSSSTPTGSHHQPSDSTPLAIPDFSYLSETITHGMAQFEQQLNHRMHAWGNQWAQKLRDAVTDPDNPNVYRFKHDTS